MNAAREPSPVPPPMDDPTTTPAHFASHHPHQHRPQESSRGRQGSRWPWQVAALLGLIVWIASCGGGGSADHALPDDALVLVVSSDLAVGPQRVLVSAVDGDNRSLVTDRPVSLTFFSPDGAPSQETEARFVWAIPEIRGLWVAKVDFDYPGTWTPAVRTVDDRLVRGAPFAVNPDGSAVQVGEPAPASPSKTEADGPIETITSDPDPDPRFYRMTVGDAVGSGRPSVIVFATPAFCVSGTCGPSLEVAKSLIDQYPEVNWIHVEVYENLDAPSREALLLAEAVVEWGLPSEPWVFVVDHSGVVVDRFEGVIGRMELAEALERVIHDPAPG